jgi:TonB family protein
VAPSSINRLVVVAGLLLARPVAGAIETQNIPPPPEAEPVPAPVLTRAPELMVFQAAAYPEALLNEGLGGEVVLQIEIDETGEVAQVALLSASRPAFAAPAIEAATRFRFSPAEVDGAPTAIRIEYRYVFDPQAMVPDAIAGEPMSVTAALQPVNFRGRVREAGNRTPIAGAIITIGGRALAEAGPDGEFEVHGAPTGTIHVRLSAPNYADYEVDEDLGYGLVLQVNYYLVRKSVSPFETVVRTRAERQEVSKVELQRQEVSKVPGTFGDPVRVIENLPGMNRTPGGLGGALLVRGDRPSSTSVYMDGVKIPLLYHFGGLTSVVNSEFLERIDFYPGGFGARYGDATAGIVDVATRDLSCEILRGSAKVDLIDAAAFLCAPIGEWHVAAAARRSYIDALLPLFIDAIRGSHDDINTVSPRYWDYQARANRVVGAHALDIFAFGSDDQFKIITRGIGESMDRAGGVHLTFHRLVGRDRWRLNDDMTLTSSVAPGFMDDTLSYESATIDFRASLKLKIWTVDWREDFVWKMMDGLTLNAGLDHRFGTAGFRMDNPFPTELRWFPTPTFDFTAIQTFQRDMNGFNEGYWLELVAEPVKGVKLVPGLRFERWDFFHTQDYSILPRLTARWELVTGTTAKAAYGLYERLPDPNYLMDAIGNPALRPERAQHFIAGVEQVFTPLVSLDVQGFYILRSRIPTPSAKITYTDGRAIAENFDGAATGWTYGGELLLRHLAAQDSIFYGWISYTLSRTVERDRFLGAGMGGASSMETEQRPLQEHLAIFDQTHILTIVGQWILPAGFELGFRLRLVSGNPYTPLDRGRVFYDADNDSYVVDLTGVTPYSARMPAFKQLDVRLDRTWVFDLWRFTAYLEVVNATYAKNVESYRYDFRFLKKTALTFLPILPVFGVKGEF